MKITTTQVGGVTLDEIESGGLRLQMSRLGAEMIGLSLDGVGLLYRDGLVERPPTGWGNHATVMGYFIHRLWQQQSLYRGRKIEGGNHGFLRSFAFDAPQVLADGLAYHVPADRVPSSAYPLRVSCTVSYRILADSVRIEFTFSNEEPELTAHLSFGLHPGFAVSSLSAAQVTCPAGTYVRHLAPGNFLNGETQVLEFPGGDFPYEKAALSDSYLIGIEGVAHREFILCDAPRGVSVSLDFSEVPFVTFWSDADDFLCIEPCWGLPDSNPPLAFEDKVGIQTIPPRASRTWGFSITPALLST